MRGYVHMGLSVGGIGTTYGMSFVQPLNYSIKNNSDVSDAFKETGLKGEIENVPPVIYPNAQKVNKMYNEVAEKFQGMTVGYGSDSVGLSYGMEGNSVDLFA